MPVPVSPTTITDLRVAARVEAAPSTSPMAPLTAKKLLESGLEVTAIYAVADSLAIGACRAVIEAGKRIPKDISVAGYDGIEMGEYYNPKLTTMKQPVEEIAKKTIRLLLDVIGERREHQQIVLPAELVVRDSTGPCSD